LNSDTPSIRYSVSISSVTNNIISVKLDIAEPDKHGQKLTLPAWIPGSYMIRDFSKNIVQLVVATQDGRSLNYHKTNKQTWQIEPYSGPLSVEYSVYAFDLSVRSAYLNDEFAFFNGTSLFLAVEGQTDNKCEVEFSKPSFDCAKNWRVATSLPVARSTHIHDFGEYQAANYGDLIDHPVVYSHFDLVQFAIDEVKFELVLVGGHHANTARISEDLKKICQHHFDLFEKPIPFKRYLFLTLLSHSGFGGLEHKYSTALMYSRDQLLGLDESAEPSEGYRTFLSLCSHELFHAWHVKRIQPLELQNASLLKEAYTEQLWIYEGFTSYFDDASLARCKVISNESYLEIVGQNLTRLLRNNGRMKQTITESSYDAWTKFYQQDASAINNIVSYYNKGAIVAMCLDLSIRLESSGKYSLDDVMKLLWNLHGKTGLGTDKYVIQQILDNKLNLDLDDFLDNALYTTNELPVEALLREFGISLKTRARVNQEDKGGKPQSKCAKHAFGAVTVTQDTGVKITQVSEKSPASIAGLQVGDHLITIDSWQVNNDQIQSRIDQCFVGTNVELVCLRDRKLKVLTMPIMPAPLDTIYLEVSDREKLKEWLIE
jgi:predicted metalloprotease with PDZ domain